MELAAEHQPGAHACADREEDEVVDTSRDALPLLAQSGQVDVVLERDRQAEGALKLVCERSALEAGDVLRQAENARVTLDHPRDSDDDAVDSVGVEARGAEEGRAESLDRLDR